MPSPTPPVDSDRLALRSAGALAAVYTELAALQARLAALRDWQPAASLAAEADWVRQQLDQMAATWSNKLVVALAGPSGAGKSTLLNALAGHEISPTGLERPTTRSLIAYVADEADIAALRARWGQADIQVRLAPAAPALQYLVLVDAPDTNTTPVGLAALGRVLDTADVVITVFAAQNPRLHDNIQFLAPYIRRLPPESVVPVVNMVDRAPLAALQEQVLPDLRQALAADWNLHPEHIYLVSAKASLPDASFAPDEQPLHTLNEFDALRQFLFEALNRASQVVDRRLARAQHLLALVNQDLAAAIAEHRPAIESARDQLRHANQAMANALQEKLQRRASELRGLDLHAALYGQLASRWWGPVGWVVALWSLIVRAVAWLSHLGQHHRPLSGDSATALLLDVSDLDETLAALYAEYWPPVADVLSAAGFGRLREPQRRQAEVQHTREQLQAHSTIAVSEALEQSARRLAHPLLQVALNGPVLGLLGWVGYQTVAAFVSGDYLPAEYFQNAGTALLALWAAGFVLLQVIVSLAVRSGVKRRAARALASTATEQLGRDLLAQLAILLEH